MSAFKSPEESFLGLKIKSGGWVMGTYEELLFFLTKLGDWF